MASFSQFGNDLYTGARSFDIVGRRRLWFIISAVAIVLSLAVPIVRGGYVFGIVFTGGSEFRLIGIGTTRPTPADDAVNPLSYLHLTPLTLSPVPIPHSLRPYSTSNLTGK